MTAYVLLPPAHPSVSRLLTLTGHLHHVVEPVDGPDGSLAARVCAAINLLDPEPPLVVVAAGKGGLLLPAVARSQHSAHRRIIGYLLVEPELPPVTDTWPDAPVTVVPQDEWVATQARLRGWGLADSLQDWSAPEW